MNSTNNVLSELSEFDYSMRVLLERANAVAELIEMAGHYLDGDWTLSDDTLQIAATAVCVDLKNAQKLLKEFRDKQRQATPTENSGQLKPA